MLGGAGRTKEWNDKGRQKWRDTLDKESPIQAPYKADARSRQQSLQSVLMSSPAEPEPLPCIWRRIMLLPVAPIRPCNLRTASLRREFETIALDAQGIGRRMPLCDHDSRRDRKADSE
jgi:hypothetical protein